MARHLRRQAATPEVVELSPVERAQREASGEVYTVAETRERALRMLSILAPPFNATALKAFGLRAAQRRNVRTNPAAAPRQVSRPDEARLRQKSVSSDGLRNNWNQQLLVVERRPVPSERRNAQRDQHGTDVAVLVFGRGLRTSGKHGLQLPVVFGLVRRLAHELHPQHVQMDIHHELDFAPRPRPAFDTGLRLRSSFSPNHATRTRQTAIKQIDQGVGIICA